MNRSDQPLSREPRDAPPTVRPERMDWQRRLTLVIDSMRELSLQTDPQVAVRSYAVRARQLTPSDRLVSLSRRGLERPWFRITRSDLWKEEINPWRQKDRLPLMSGGLLAELIYGDAPRIIDDLTVAPDDPAAEYLSGMRSLMAIPHFDRGQSLNMVVLMKAEPRGFDPERLPDATLQGNLFGRAVYNLVLSAELKQALDTIDRELRTVASIQRSLLPAALPKLPTLDLAVHYETSTQAGGDYYDFFPLPDGRLGILIADVTGHGTPAAVMMAITHAIAHTYPGAPDQPAVLLNYLNQQLCGHYTIGGGTFVTAFFGVFDPVSRELTYASAGHPPPRLKRCDDGSMAALDAVSHLPLGIEADTRYEQAGMRLRAGDQLIFYTDGITEAFNPGREQFGVERLDAVLGACRPHAASLIAAVLEAVSTFTAGRPADDDRTLLVAKVG